MNRVLAARSLPQYDVEAYRQMVGWGLKRLAELAVPAGRRGEVDISELAEELKREYARTAVVHTSPYDGVRELIDELKRRGLPMAVLSNKAQELTQHIVETVFGGATFDAVYGAREGLPNKPHPGAAIAIAEELGVATTDMVFIGDTAIDMETAQAAGMYPVGVDWGYRDVEELWMHGAATVMSSPQQIRALILDDEDTEDTEDTENAQGEIGNRDNT